jgi:uroporphyrinogen III methyltransferase/synthase
VADALVDGQYGWVIFSSPRAVELFFRHLARMCRDARAFHATQVIAAGADTAEALADRGIIPDGTAEEPMAAAILGVLPKRSLTRQRMLLPRAEESQRELLDGLLATGAEVEDVPLYVSSVPQAPNRAALRLLKRGEIDAVVFPSSSAVTNFTRMLGDPAPLRGVTVACVSPVTAETAREAGLRVDVVGEPATQAGVVRALAQFAARGGLLRAAGSAGR